MGKGKWMQKIRHWIEYSVVMFVLLWVWMAPREFVLKAAGCLGSFVFHVLRIRRDVTLANLDIAFPELSREEKKGIGLRTYRHIARLAFDLMRFPVMKREISRICEVQGKEELEWCVSHGKGAILLGAHFGNWEYIGPSLVQLGFPITYLVKEQKNKKVDEVISGHRARMGIELIPLGMGVRRIMKALSGGQFVVILADQDAGPGGLFIDFFGRKTSTAQGPAALALRTGAEIIFFSIFQRGRGGYRLVLKKLSVDHNQEPSGTHLQKIMEQYSFLLEKEIRRRPDHWFWMHRRWKTPFPGYQEKV